jgi:uncharacterized membrane protein
MEMRNEAFRIIFPLIIIIDFIGFIIPSLIRKSILFGSRLPDELIDSKEIKHIKQSYKHTFLTAMFPAYIIACFLIYNFTSPFVLVGSIILQWLLIIIIYAIFNKKVKEVKTEFLQREKDVPAKQVRLVDTKFRQGKYLVSPWWFLPSLFVVFLNFIIVLASYAKISARIPIHFNFKGTANGFMDKSYFHVLAMPITSAVTLLIFVGIYYIIKKSKQEIDASSPEISKQQNRRFRFLWSSFILITAFVLTVWFLFVSLFADGIISLSQVTFEVLNLILPFYILLTVILLSVKIGQSGSRLKVSAVEAKTNMRNIDDDRNWKFGMIYFNPDDPSLFVEKRLGVGWTINFGRPAALIIIAAIIVIVITSEILTR